MVRIVALFLFLCAATVPAHAAAVSWDITETYAQFTVQFETGYTNPQVVKSETGYVITFETGEPVLFEKKEFFDLPLKDAYLVEDQYRKKLVFTFSGSIIEPKVTTAQNALSARFEFPKLKKEVEEVNSGVSYGRMIFGLGVIVAVIIMLFWALRKLSKRQVFTEIPGTGRLLGKVDLDIRKHLYFYELGECIYILGVTDSGMTLIDKICDEEEVMIIKAGFARKKDFSGYFSLFQKKEDIDKDLGVTRSVVEEKLQSLKKK